MAPRSPRRPVVAVCVALLACTAASACSRAEPQSAPSSPDPAESAQVTTKAAASATSKTAPLVLAHGVRFVKAGAENDVAKLVRSEREKAVGDGRDLVVYVGAKWCEPCRHFHQAAARGDLDGEFPDLTILEFDLDEDRDRITTANYDSKMIPLFVYPGADGRGSERRFEGSVKGPQAAANITPRLRKLLGK